MNATLLKITDPGYFGYSFKAVYVLFGFMGLFILISLVALVIVFYHRSRVMIVNRRVSKLQKRYREILSLCLFDNSNTLEYFKGMFRPKDYLGKLNRNVLQEMFFLFYRDFTGESREKLKQLYFDFQFDEYSLKKLQSGKWDTQSQAINEIVKMDLKEYIPEIEALTRSDNPILRSEAMAAMFKLKDFADISFIINSKKNISEWEQISILAMLLNAHIDNVPVPKFKEGLNAENESAQLFSIRLIGFFNQYEAIPELVNLIDHKAVKIRLAAINALIHLHAKEAVLPLQNRLKKHANNNGDLSREEYFLIIKALGMLGEEDVIPFLEKELTDNDEEKNLVVARAFYGNGDKARVRLKELHAIKYPSITKVIQQVKSEYRV